MSDKSRWDEPWRPRQWENGEVSMISAKDARQAAEKALKEKRAQSLAKELGVVCTAVRTAMLEGHMSVRFNTTPELASHLRGLGYVVSPEDDHGQNTISWEKAE